MYNLIIKRETNKEGRKMTKAERNAIKARTRDLINQGVEKEIAQVMAKVELETGLINVVVQSK